MLLALLLVLGTGLLATAEPITYPPIVQADPRFALNGNPILDASLYKYQDQPQIVVDPHTGKWSCALTVNSAHEGQGAQRVVSTTSTDQGKTWNAATVVEKSPLDTGWINNLLSPDGRQWAFYTFNADNVTSVPPGKPAMSNFNLLGSWVFRLSTDGGSTYGGSNDRYNMSNGPGGGIYRETDIDRSNAWGGAVREGWSIGKPLITDDKKTVYMQFSKVSTLAHRSEGFFLRSSNILTPGIAPSAVEFELVPRGDFGLRATSQTVAEEGNLVQRPSDGGFVAFFRTENGYLNSAVSKDGAVWKDKLFAIYDQADISARAWYGTFNSTSNVPEEEATATAVVTGATPPYSGLRIKNSRGPISPRRFSNGLYLCTLFFNSDIPGFESRDPYFIMGGRDDPDGAGILWSQPEIMLYVLPKCEDARCGLGYPDFIERGSNATITNATSGVDAAWSIMLSETDKEVSRTHTLDMAVLHGLWTQSHIKSVAAKGVALEWQNPAIISVDGTRRKERKRSNKPTQLPAPHFGNLSTGVGFSIEIGFWSEQVAQAQPTILFDCRATAGANAGENAGANAGAGAGAESRRGVALVQSGSTFGVVNISLADSDGKHQTWDTDRESKLCGEGSGRSSSVVEPLPPAATQPKMVANHVVFTVDGSSRTIMSVVNGKLSDGGTVRSHGWAHLGSHFDIAGGGGIGDVDGAPVCTVDTRKVRMVRVYNRYLTTTEAIGNWRNWTTSSLFPSSG